jgi:hypothetical protein
MRLFIKLALCEFLEALIIVACTRAWVVKSYGWTAVLEVAFMTEMFYSKKMTFDEEKARSWKFGYPAQVLGALAGTLLGLLISTRMLGE